jgi:3'(2'), 5'-bisphosphate nucleotidase
MAQDPEIAAPSLLDGLTRIASEAAAAVVAIDAKSLGPRRKPDNSPITAADEASEAIVLQGLAGLLPGVPVVSEEASGRNVPAALGERFLLVDPLDGTRELLAGEAEYTINIALVSGGVPAIGVIAAPALGLIWRGSAAHGAERLRLAPGVDPGAARERTAIRTRPRPAVSTVAVISRFHRDAETDAYLERLPNVQRMVVGSSIKFCRLAEGSADIYARLSSLSEWDAAAGHALVVAAGGAMTTIAGEPLPYGRRGFRLPPFIAVGDRSFAACAT